MKTQHVDPANYLQVLVFHYEGAQLQRQEKAQGPSPALYAKSRGKQTDQGRGHGLFQLYRDRDQQLKARRRLAFC